jgi:hypothetical protein
MFLFLLLKYLPNVLKSAAEAYKTYTEGVKTSEEGRLIKENRRLLSLQIDRDEVLSQMSDEEKLKVRQILELLYSYEASNLRIAQDFANDSVESVQLNLKPEEVSPVVGEDTPQVVTMRH